MMGTGTAGSFDQRATTPRAAAGAGIAFALLFSVSMILFQSALPADPRDISTFTAASVSSIEWAARVMPFAGIAFLWFIGAMRQRLGDSEDRFYGTVMFGSGVLFTAMVFVAFAFVSGILVSRNLTTPALAAEGYVNDQSIAQQIFSIYVLKMAAVFMTSLSALWRKTHVMPNGLTGLTLLLAAVLLVTTSISTWMVLVFPAWVLIVSLYLMISGLRQRETSDYTATDHDEGEGS